MQALAHVGEQRLDAGEHRGCGAMTFFERGDQVFPDHWAVLDDERLELAEVVQRVVQIGK